MLGIDITRETVVDLNDVARRLRVHIKTVRGWGKRLNGRRLETVKLGGKIVTSLEALQRFAISNGPGGAGDSKSPRPRPKPDSARCLKEAHGI